MHNQDAPSLSTESSTAGTARYGSLKRLNCSEPGSMWLLLDSCRYYKNYDMQDSRTFCLFLKYSNTLKDCFLLLFFSLLVFLFFVRFLFLFGF